MGACDKSCVGLATASGPPGCLKLGGRVVSALRNHTAGRAFHLERFCRLVGKTGSARMAAQSPSEVGMRETLSQRRGRRKI